MSYSSMLVVVVLLNTSTSSTNIVRLISTIAELPAHSFQPVVLLFDCHKK